MIRTPSSSKTKNQHFVPQFLLKKFSSPVSEGRSIAAFDLSKPEIRYIRAASIRDQCSKRYTYGEDGQMESNLAQLESSAAVVIRDILGSNNLPRERFGGWKALIKFMVVQYGRTPGAANHCYAQQHRILEELKKTPGFSERFKPTDTIENLYETSRLPELHSLLYMPRMAPIVEDLHDALIINHSPIEFITSDIAVVFHNHWADGVENRGCTGFAAAGLLIIMPVSPKHMVIKFDPSVYIVEGSKTSASSNVIVSVIDQADVKELNRFQYTYAERFIYFSGHEATKEDILSEPYTRFPLSSLVQSKRLFSLDGSAELIHTYAQRPTMSLSLPWLQIKRKKDSIPHHQRVGMYRSEALRVNEKLKRFKDDEIVSKFFSNTDRI